MNVRAHENLGDILERQGRTNEAIRHYTEALAIRLDFADAHNNLAPALRHRGRLEEASTHHHEALRLAPTAAEFHDNLGSTLARQGRLHEAVGAYRAALRVNSGFTLAGQNLECSVRQRGPASRPPVPGTMP